MIDNGTDERAYHRRVSRRRVLAGAGATAGLGLLAACGAGSSSPVGPGSPQVAAVAAAQRRLGAPVRSFALTPAPAMVDLGGPVVPSWAYAGAVPGPLIRATAGDQVRVQVDNRLPEPTTVHWHGLAIRNDMDGVDGVTQPPIPPGSGMGYQFSPPDPGTYWYHPHVGTQLDRGLQGPLIIDDPREPGGYDVEFVVVLDDWIDGTGTTPDQVLANLRAHGMNMSDMNGMGGMGGMGGGAVSPLGSDTGDVDYPYYLINGRVPTAPVTLTARPGQRARIRVINVGGDTPFRVALEGHQLTVTHADGYPVEPATVDALIVGMAERYDVITTLGDGAFTLAAAAEGKTGGARALVRTSPSAAAPPAGYAPAQLGGRLLPPATGLQATSADALAPAAPDRTLDAVLAGDMARYIWTINGRTYDQYSPLPVRQGERVRLRYTNQTMMFHPMHLHGHTFQVRRAGPSADTVPGPRKDTVIVPAMGTVEIDFAADNPGQWLTHCHNVYHQNAGMMTVLSYRS